jgi:hypothetical protein
MAACNFRGSTGPYSASFGGAGVEFIDDNGSGPGVRLRKQEAE